MPKKNRKRKPVAPADRGRRQQTTSAVRERAVPTEGTDQSRAGQPGSADTARQAFVRDAAPAVRAAGTGGGKGAKAARDRRAGATAPSRRRGGGPPSRDPRSPTVQVTEETRVAPHGCAEAVSTADPQGLAASYSFDTRGWSTTGPVTIGFVGTRVDDDARQDGRQDGRQDARQVDRFERLERLPELSAATGRVSITARVLNIPAGTWRVVVGPVENPAGHDLPAKAVVAQTQFGLLAQGPGVRLSSWPLLVGLGALVAIVTQGLLLAQAGLPVGSVMGLSVLGCLLGYPTGKAWYLAVNRRPLREFMLAGACIQGFLLGALLVLTLGVLALGESPGAVLDATAPGIFLGMAVGRPGCWLTGCCAGRPTNGWGLWSSDRRLGIRRIPVQLLEAGVGLLIGLTALALQLGVPAPFGGAVFVLAVAAYTAARQVLFRMRSESHTDLGRRVVLALSSAVVLLVAAGYALAA